MNYRDNLKEKKVSIFLCPRKQIGVHSHNFLELVYVFKGEAIHNWDNKNVSIKEGDYFVIDYQSHHSYKAKTDDFELINCLFVPEFIDSSLANCHSFNALISSYQIHFNNDFFTASPSAIIYKDENGRIRELLLSILNEFTEKSPGYLQFIRSQIIEILIITMRKIYFDPSPDVDNSDIKKILKHTSEKYMDNLTLSAICKNLGYSFSYMSAKFKKETGLTFTEYLQKTRIEQSMRLLVHTDKTINTISNDVGYSDIKSYYKAFKKTTNTTPAKFRKNYYKNI